MAFHLDAEFFTSYIAAPSMFTEPTGAIIMCVSVSSPIHPWQVLPLGIWYCCVPLFISLVFVHCSFNCASACYLLKCQQPHVEAARLQRGGQQFLKVLFFFCTRFSFMAAFVRLLSLLVLVLHRFRNKAELVSGCLSCGLSPRTCSVLRPSQHDQYFQCVLRSPTCSYTTLYLCDGLCWCGIVGRVYSENVRVWWGNKHTYSCMALTRLAPR